MEKIDRLADMLFSLGDVSVRQRWTRHEQELLERSEVGELALAQQRLLASGFSTTRLWRIWNQNSRLLPDQAARLRTKLPANHILRRVLAEHEMFLCFVADLKEVTERLKQMTHASSLTEEVRRLEHIVNHLLGYEQHHQREDDVIFPYLEKHGFSDMLAIARKQHEESILMVRSINDLLWHVDELSFGIFQHRLDKLVLRVVPEMRMHIFLEDNILLPLALEMIKDHRVWQRMKEIADSIGYCGFSNR